MQMSRDESASSTGEPKTTMKAFQLIKHLPKNWADDESLNFDDYFAVNEIPIPKPRSGEVLIKVERTPINPADLSGLKGTYDANNRSALPFTPGIEGSGVVVETGGGLLAWRLGGKRVAAAYKSGLWAQYACVPALNCIILPDDVSFDTGSMALVNPITVLGFIDEAQYGGHQNIVHTAAASALGKMLLRLAQKEGINVICIVRREEQAEELRALGAKDVFVTDNDSHPNWQKEFKARCAELNCTLGFDCVAGDLSGHILHNMPKGSVLKIYGGLSEQPCVIPPGDFIYQNKRVEGFWATEVVKQKSLMKLYLWQRRIAMEINSVLSTSVASILPLHQVATALVQYRQNMGKGKVLLAPNLAEGSGLSGDKDVFVGEQQHHDKGKDKAEASSSTEGEDDAQSHQSASE